MIWLFQGNSQQSVNLLMWLYTLPACVILWSVHDLSFSVVFEREESWPNGIVYSRGTRSWNANYVLTILSPATYYYTGFQAPMKCSELKQNEQTNKTHNILEISICLYMIKMPCEWIKVKCIELPIDFYEGGKYNYVLVTFMHS